MRLTKTQQALIERAKLRGVISVTECWGRGAQGGKVSGGAREMKAARDLVKLGVFRQVNPIGEPPFRDTNAGNTTFYRSNVFELAEPQIEGFRS